MPQPHRGMGGNEFHLPATVVALAVPRQPKQRHFDRSPERAAGESNGRTGETPAFFLEEPQIRGCPIHAPALSPHEWERGPHHRPVVAQAAYPDISPTRIRAQLIRLRLHQLRSLEG